MGLIDETLRVALSDFYYFKRNVLILVVSSMVTPVLYMVAFGYGLGQGVMMGGVTYIAYMIPGVISLTTLSGTFDTVSHKIMVQKRFYESFDEMLLCPISKSSIILGRSLLGIVKGMLCGTILVVVGSLFSPDFHISLGLFGMMLLSCTVFSIFGFAAGVMIKDLAHMSIFTSFVIIPMTFLCGTMFSLDTLPAVLRTAINLLPLSFTSDCIRSIALQWDFPVVSFVALALYGVFFYALAYYVLSKSR